MGYFTKKTVPYISCISHSKWTVKKNEVTTDGLGPRRRQKDVFSDLGKF